HSDAVASSPFFNIFQTCILGALTLEETRQLITVPTRQSGLEFTTEEVEWVISVAGRHPFYVQVTSQCLFDEKMRYGNANVDLKLVQERVYRELEPHFVKTWDDLSEEQKQDLKPELTQVLPERRKMPELSESSLFRERVREFVQVNGAELSVKDLKDVLDHIDDNEVLENSRFAEMHYITLSMRASPQTKKGVLV